MTDRSDLLDKLDSGLLETAVKLATIFKEKGGNLLLVGGSVRDLILNQSPHELDFEARGPALKRSKNGYPKILDMTKWERHLEFFASKATPSRLLSLVLKPSPELDTRALMSRPTPTFHLSGQYNAGTLRLMHWGCAH